MKAIGNGAMIIWIIKENVQHPGPDHQDEPVIRCVNTSCRCAACYPPTVLLTQREEFCLLVK